MSLAVRYALSWLGLENPDAIYREVVNRFMTATDETVSTYYTWLLTDPPRRITPQTLAESACMLASHEVERNRTLATYILTTRFGRRGDWTFDGLPTAAFEGCSDSALASLIVLVWSEFLVLTGLRDRYQTIHAGDRMAMRRFLDDWRTANALLWEQKDGGDERLELHRCLMQMLDVADSRAARRPQPSDESLPGEDSPGHRGAPPRAADEVEARHDLAFALLQRGRLDDAIREYREILRLSPDDAAAHLNLGIALKMNGQLNDAIQELREALRLGFEDAETHYTLANAFVQKGSFDEAIQEYEEALSLTPGLADTHLKCHINLGLAFQQKGLLDEAIHQFRQALRLSTAFADAHYFLGNAMQEKGLLDEAIGELREALRLKPNLWAARISLASALAEKGLGDESVEELRKLLGQD